MFSERWGEVRSESVKELLVGRHGWHSLAFPDSRKLLGVISLNGIITRIAHNLEIIYLHHTTFTDVAQILKHFAAVTILLSSDYR